MPDEIANGAYDDPDWDIDGNVEGRDKMPETPKESAEKILSRAFMSDAEHEQHARTVAAELLRLLAPEEGLEWRVTYELYGEPHVSLFVDERWADSWIARMMTKDSMYSNIVKQERMKSRPAGEWREEKA